MPAGSTLFQWHQPPRPGGALAPVYSFHRVHVGHLLGELVGETPRAEYLADALLAPLSAQAFLYQREVREMSIEQLRDGWRALATAITADAASIAADAAW
jgi:hypothetical protein